MNLVIDVPPYRTPAWHKWRCHGLGASDLPVIVGVSRWTGEYELALEKRGEVTRDDTDTAPMAWGKRIESVALDEVAERIGQDIVRGETWVDDRHPRLWATLDGRVGRVGYEVKATSRRSVDAAERVQALGQIGLADLDLVNIVHVSPFGEPILTPVERDDDAITDLLALAEAWLERYVDGDELPPPDGSRASMRHLDKLRGEEEAEATAEQAVLMGALRLARKRIEAAETEERAIVAALKASMAGTGVLRGEGFRVVWSATKGREKVDWRSVAAIYCQDLTLRGVSPDDTRKVVDEYTTVGEPSTSFRPTWEEEEERG